MIIIQISYINILYKLLIIIQGIKNNKNNIIHLQRIKITIVFTEIKITMIFQGLNIAIIKNNKDNIIHFTED